MTGRTIAFVVAAAIAGSCTFSERQTASTAAGGTAATEQWVATWMAPQQLVEPRNMPPAPGLDGNTLRQNIRITHGGRAIHFHFSNEYGTAPLEIDAAHVARSEGGNTTVAESDRALLFDGRNSVVIQPGATIASDPLDIELGPLSDLTVSIHFGSVPDAVTGHPGSRTTSWIAMGDRTADVALDSAATVDRWFVLARADVLAPAIHASVVALGNSITDGRGSGTNMNTRWPDYLAERLQADPGTAHVGVINAGIGGNAVLGGGLGPYALSRYDRDVLDQPGARWVIILEGVNDIGGSTPENAAQVAQRLISAYSEMIERAHERGLRVYGATMPPFGGSFYDSPQHEAARQEVNRWIRTSNAFDAVIDFDAAIRDPTNPTRLLPAADSGDQLHPGEEGYRMMADAIDLDLFRQPSGNSAPTS